MPHRQVYVIVPGFWLCPTSGPDAMSPDGSRHVVSVDHMPLRDIPLSHIREAGFRDHAAMVLAWGHRIGREGLIPDIMTILTVCQTNAA